MHKNGVYGKFDAITSFLIYNHNYLKCIDRGEQVSVEEKSNNRNYIRIVIAVIVICAIVLFCRSCIHNDGSGTGTTGNQLEEAGNNQSTITGGINDAENTANGIAGSIGESETAIGNADATVSDIENQQREAGSLIADCQRILEAIRNRNEGKTE